MGYCYVGEMAEWISSVRRLAAMLGLRHGESPRARSWLEWLMPQSPHNEGLRKSQEKQGRKGRGTQDYNFKS